MLADPDRNKAKRVMDAFMKMHKFDLAEIERAYAA
jgi:predicted 3-demethylubiquinone-9 3-methyltransferase (glyoxalase superfamily)